MLYPIFILFIPTIISKRKWSVCRYSNFYR